MYAYTAYGSFHVYRPIYGQWIVHVATQPLKIN